MKVEYQLSAAPKRTSVVSRRYALAFEFRSYFCTFGQHTSACRSHACTRAQHKPIALCMCATEFRFVFIPIMSVCQPLTYAQPHFYFKWYFIIYMFKFAKLNSFQMHFMTDIGKLTCDNIWTSPLFAILIFWSFNFKINKH